MSKMNVYRACLLTLLAVVVYIWHFAAILLGAWWAMALLGVWAKRIDPSHGERNLSQIMNSDIFGALNAWLGDWNSFYVWKDLDNDYWPRKSE
jgi:hypothetical protein